MSCVIKIVAVLSLFTPALAADQTPDFTLPDLDGGKFKLYEQLKQGPILINFWATWCKSCLQELPALDQICQTYSKEGLQVVAISIDNSKTKAKVKPFANSSGFKFTVLLDTDLEVRKLFGGTSTPFSVLISPTGEIVYQHLGYVPGDEKELEREVVKLLQSLKPIAPDAGSAPAPVGDIH